MIGAKLEGTGASAVEVSQMEAIQVVADLSELTAEIILLLSCLIAIFI